MYYASLATRPSSGGLEARASAAVALSGLHMPAYLLYCTSAPVVWAPARTGQHRINYAAKWKGPGGCSGAEVP